MNFSGSNCTNFVLEHLSFSWKTQFICCSLYSPLDMSGASKIIDVDKSQVEYLGRQILPVGTLKSTFLKNFVFRTRQMTQTYFFWIVACFVTNWQTFYYFREILILFFIPVSGTRYHSWMSAESIGLYVYIFLCFTSVGLPVIYFVCHPRHLINVLEELQVL